MFEWFNLFNRDSKKYKDILEGRASLEAINWPGISEEYKIVQFSRSNDLYIRFAPKPRDSSQHTDIVELFGYEIGVENKMSSRQKIGYSVAELPNKCKFKIEGMGRCDLYLENPVLKAIFFGESLGYGDKINKQHLADIKKSFPLYDITFHSTYNGRLFEEMKKDSMR